MFTETLKTLFKIWSCLIDAERVQSIFQGLPEPIRTIKPISTIRPIRTRLVLMNPFRVFQVMIQILKDMGVTEYEPRVINQMLEFTYSKSLKKKKVQIRWPLAGSDLWPLLSSGYVTTIIEDAKIYASHAKKSAVDADDIKLAIQCRMDQSFTSPPPRDVSPAKLWPRARFWFWFWCPWCALCPVPTGGGAAEEPDAAAAHQALHRPASAARPLLPHRSQLPPQVHPEEGLLLFLTPNPRSDDFWPLTSLPLQVSSSAGRISVPRLSVGAVSSRPTTPTLGESRRGTSRTSTQPDLWPLCLVLRNPFGPVGLL